MCNDKTIKTELATSKTVIAVILFKSRLRAVVILLAFPFFALATIIIVQNTPTTNVAKPKALTV